MFPSGICVGVPSSISKYNTIPTFSVIDVCSGVDFGVDWNLLLNPDEKLVTKRVIFATMERDVDFDENTGFHRVRLELMKRMREKGDV